MVLKGSCDNICTGEVADFVCLSFPIFSLLHCIQTLGQDITYNLVPFGVI